MGEECGLNSVRDICSMAILESAVNKVSWACSGEAGAWGSWIIGVFSGAHFAK